LLHIGTTETVSQGETPVYQEVFSKLSLAASASEVSQPISMEGSNSAQVDAVVFVWGGGTPPTNFVVIQASNDLENWTTQAAITSWNPGAVAAPTGVGAWWQVGPTPSASIAAAYIRLKVFNGTGGTSVVSVGVNVSKL
jgi:hypothetical protein